ncbi:MAG: FmdE family protein [Candidatus Omnitrophica bacterium]|nr:FmdE family protein [Candidatus Omnitrophota bacterium]MDD5236509.1 FmdE family protein [Candidatus Omnitrophota bacterium]MDD5610396.1 FmdE family protein [Candidatus Omnitrophota bacterium]
MKRIGIKEAEIFHGHLGPYLVLGLLAGELALKNLKCKKYFGLQVKVWGVDQKPKSCLIDGLQLSTGATFGKGNIAKFSATRIKIEVSDCINKKKATLRLKNDIVKILEKTKTHQDAESLAKKLYKTAGLKIFNLKNQE